MMNSVKKNIVWNLLGNVLPLLVGLVFFPLIIKAYGLERFGLLTLAWALVGYFGLFDFGLSRALTQLVSESIANRKTASDVAELIKTCFGLMWILGFLGGLVLWLGSTWIVTGPLNINHSLQQESILAFSILAFSIPIVIHASAMRGVLEALHLFKIASLIRMILGVGTFLAPYLASIQSHSLVGAIQALFVVRIIVWAMYFFAVRHSGILDAATQAFNLRWVKPLFTFGGWMTVTNIIGPLMTYMDRFVIVAILGAASVSYYVAPYEVVTKMLVIPVAIAGVLFPLFAKEWQLQPAQSAYKLNQGILYTLITLFPPCLFLIYFAHEWLLLWLGKGFSEQAALVVTWLVVGVLVNSVAQILFAKVQGSGRSDWTAKLHLLELFPYLGFLWMMLNSFGIAGAAFAWFIRVVVDAFGLIYFSRKISQHNFLAIKSSLKLLAIVIAILLCSIFLESLLIRVIFAFAFIVIYIALAFNQLRRDNVFGWVASSLKRT